MADENPTPEVTPPAADAQAAAAAAADAVRVQADNERLAKIEKQIGALADVVKTAMTPRAPVQAGDSAVPGQLPPHFRQMLRNNGLSEADIDANAPIIVPFLTALLATDGAVIMGNVQNVRDEVEMVKAAKQTKKYPHWGEVEDKIVELREDAAKQGQYLSPADAYKAAVALDVASPESRLLAARERAKAQGSAGDDATAQNLPHTGAARSVKRTALSAEEIAALPREQRKKLFAEGGLGDLPIR